MFHFVNAINKQIIKLGLSGGCLRNPVFLTLKRMFCSLAYLPHDKISPVKVIILFLKDFVRILKSNGLILLFRLYGPLLFVKFTPIITQKDLTVIPLYGYVIPIRLFKRLYLFFLSINFNKII